MLSSDFSQGVWVSFPVSVAAGGTVAITVTRLAGGNAVLSGIFLGDTGAPPGPTVASAPQGTWAGAVGSAGYALAGWNGATDLTSLSNATLTVEQASRYTWAGPTSDVRALQSPDRSTRIAATYYDPNEIRLKLTFKEAYAGTLRLYAVDWDSAGRREVISVNGGQHRAVERLQPGRLGLVPDQRHRRGHRLGHGHLPGRGQCGAVGDLPGVRARAPSAPQPL